MTVDNVPSCYDYCCREWHSAVVPSYTMPSERAAQQLPSLVAERAAGRLGSQREEAQRERGCDSICRRYGAPPGAYSNHSLSRTCNNVLLNDTVSSKLTD